jgi:hypothetical protein
LEEDVNELLNPIMKRDWCIMAKDADAKFLTEDGRWVKTREEAATIYIEQWGERYGPFTPREVGYLDAQYRG